MGKGFGGDAARIEDAFDAGCLIGELLSEAGDVIAHIEEPVACLRVGMVDI